MATNFTVDFSDKRFSDVENEKKKALDESNALYQGMIDQSDDFYNKQIDAVKKNAEEQAKIQNEQTDFTIEKIEQQREQAEADYLKEQSGAYADWKEQSNPYGVEAEKQAAMGMGGTGYSESSQVRMYTAYQNRVAIARDGMARANLNFDNGIKEAKLQNSSILAEIYADAYAKEAEFLLQGFQYKNTLLLEKANKQTELDALYYSKWKDVLNQINTENAQAEQSRQFDASLALEREQFEWQKAQAAASSSGGGGGGGGSYTKGVKGAYAYDEDGDLKIDKDTIKTEYYNGKIPQSTKSAGSDYGYFSNGYQPKGVAGHGPVKKTGHTYTFDTETLSGKKQTVTQNIWKADDGTLWYWEGRDMAYKKLPMK